MPLATHCVDCARPIRGPSAVVRPRSPFAAICARCGYRRYESVRRSQSRYLDRRKEQRGGARRCAGTTGKGAACGAWAKRGEAYCVRHEGQKPAERKRKGMRE